MRKRSENSTDNRITVRLTKKNLESFLMWAKDFKRQSDYMNAILNDYYKIHGRHTESN